MVHIFVESVEGMSDSDRTILVKFLEFCERNYTPEDSIRLVALIARIVREEKWKHDKN